MTKRTSQILLAATVPLIVWGQGSRIETIDEFEDSTASLSIRESVRPEGYRVIQEDGSILCEVWIRDTIPSQREAGVLGAVYPQLFESLLVGVVSFPAGAGDYRGQQLKPGTYTMRYELLPDDGNHLGAAPTRDFVLLVPVSTDSIAHTRFTYEELVSLSKMASGTNHPAVFNLTFPESEEPLPTVAETCEGHIVFTAVLRTENDQEIPFALVVVGEAQQ